MTLSGNFFAKMFLFSACAAGCLLSQKASATAVTVTYLSAGATNPVSTSTYESFTGLTYNGTSLTSNFGNTAAGAIHGTYTGSVSLLAADQYGGAGGTGQYIAATSGNSYTLTLNQDANYFGLWFSALDNGNTMNFYENSTLVLSFTPADFIKLVGACPSSSGYCGNPSGQFQGKDAGEQFAYLGFYDQAGAFNKIVFSQAAGGGSFESDNHSVAFLTPPTPQGTVLTAATTPEPSSMALLGTGIVGVAGVVRRRTRSSK